MHPCVVIEDILKKLVEPKFLNSRVNVFKLHFVWHFSSSLFCFLKMCNLFLESAFSFSTVHIIPTQTQHPCQLDSS